MDVFRRPTGPFPLSGTHQVTASKEGIESGYGVTSASKEGSESSYGVTSASKEGSETCN